MKEQICWPEIRVKSDLIPLIFARSCSPISYGRVQRGLTALETLLRGINKYRWKQLVFLGSVISIFQDPVIASFSQLSLSFGAFKLGLYSPPTRVRRMDEALFCDFQHFVIVNCTGLEEKNIAVVLAYATKLGSTHHSCFSWSYL